MLSGALPLHIISHFSKPCTGVANFDRFYHIYSASQANLTEIAWSSTLKNGHVKDPKHFTDTNFHCWDANLTDIVCP